MGKIHNLAGVLTDKHRHIINAVVEEISAEPSKDSIAKQLLPVVDLPAAIIEHEVLSAMGGKTGERVMGAPGKSIAGQSSQPKIFKPGSYQEFIEFTESDLLKLRKLGTIGDRGVTGLTGGELNWLERAAKKLKMRLENRLHQLIWDAIFTGQYLYQNVAFSFGIPSGNLISTASNWATTGTDPFKDLVTILKTNSKLLKYQGAIKALVINPKTEADIIKRALEAGYITNNNIASAGINVVRQFAAPGLPEFHVCNDVIADETVAADGSITLGDATFMVPDGKILVVIDFAQKSAMFPEYGQMQITENMNDPSASLDKPAVGIYTFIDEKGLEARKAPHVDVVSGFNGAPNLMRPNDVFILSYA